MLLRSPSYRSEVVGVNDRRARLERRPAARWCRGCSEGAAAAAVALEPSRSYSNGGTVHSRLPREAGNNRLFLLNLNNPYYKVFVELNILLLINPSSHLLII